MISTNYNFRFVSERARERQKTRSHSVRFPNQFHSKKKKVEIGSHLGAGVNEIMSRKNFFWQKYFCSKCQMNEKLVKTKLATLL